MGGTAFSMHRRGILVLHAASKRLRLEKIDKASLQHYNNIIHNTIKQNSLFADSTNHVCNINQVKL